jgi:hypothetical protein
VARAGRRAHRLPLRAGQHRQPGHRPEPARAAPPKEIDDNAIQTPNLWGNMGVFSGVLYEREQDGALVYSTRNLPGSRVFLKFTVATPPGEPAHEGLGKVGKPQLAQHAGSSRPPPRPPASMTPGCARSPMPKAISMRWRSPARAHRA